MAAALPLAARPSGGAFAVDHGQKLADCGLPAFAATRDGVAGYMAIPVLRGWPARARALNAMAGADTRNLLAPLGHGPAALPSGEMGYFVFCPAPPGPSLATAMRPWSEPELVEHVLKPLTAVLAGLRARDVTHRAIRADNVFQAAPGSPVTLGAAWSAPPACHQPGWMEPPYVSVCLAAGRGDGTAADDVYALGALLVALSLGGSPVAGVPEEAVLQRKLDLGSYAALVGTHRLPMALAELVHGMLADDPDHRPSLELLASPAAARARRIAARPLRRAQRAIELGSRQAWTARGLAYALQHEAAAGIALLRTGGVDRWLRRSLGDLAMAARVDEALRSGASRAAGDSGADAILIMRVAGMLDPTAPILWRSLMLWPSGFGAALDHALHHAPDTTERLVEFVAQNVSGLWAEQQGRPDAAAARQAAQEMSGWLAAGRGGSGVIRLCYGLNPLAPCDSPMAARHWVTKLAELLPALEASAKQPRGNQLLVDVHVAAFVAARRDARLDMDLAHLAGALSPGSLLSQLQLLAMLQAKTHPILLPALSAWVVDAMRPVIQQFNSRSRRARLSERLTSLGQAGLLAPIADLLGSRTELAEDTDGLAAARDRIVEIDIALADMTRTLADRTAQTRRVGQDVASGLALLACVAALAWAAFA